MIKRTLLIVAAGAVVAGLGYIRFAPMDPGVWHVDAATAARTGKPNDYLVAEGGDRPAITVPETVEAVLDRLDAVATAERGVTRLAGSAAEGRVTYVQRSKLMGYPDAISVSATQAGEGTTLSIYSRSRFGQSDLGVNEARVERWLERLNLN
ncbi:Uncharacterized conserved protein, DUF1499 family [Jannaschia faecimaris]|uniref:Uncharacterized conserved protein, DUF1499 family n=1 Tax=Jannaschia faecimaris TaxID=1244108 RepID=A0A1H3TGZ7_9RHOB|nr:DUF1499 domain-containing protein [Jannaschia faecimaris]SDZ49506.1 Uncharacterized conserved protein, DUF1499 family [Jannaschia faecimaris]